MEHNLCFDFSRHHIFHMEYQGAGRPDPTRITHSLILIIAVATAAVAVAAGAPCVVAEVVNLALVVVQPPQVGVGGVDALLHGQRRQPGHGGSQALQHQRKRGVGVVLPLRLPTPARSAGNITKRVPDLRRPSGGALHVVGERPRVLQRAVACAKRSGGWRGHVGEVCWRASLLALVRVLSEDHFL